MIINTNTKHKIILDQKIKKYLSKKHPTFKMYSFKSYSTHVRKLMSSLKGNLPMALEGNFDGSGPKDLLLFGTKKGRPVALGIMFGEKNKISSEVFFSVPKSEMGNPLDMYLVLIPKKDIKHSVGSSRDAFQVEKFGGVATAFHFNGKRIVENNPKDGFLWHGQKPLKK